MPTERYFKWIGCFVLFFVCAGRSPAQDKEATPEVFTLEEAVDFALQHYPAVRGAMERAAAARGGVSLARTIYLPRADTLWQSNRATRNNIFGLLLPQSVISPITGPVLPFTTNDAVWGSAAGLLFSWEPFDFGHRRASVNAAHAGQSRADAEVEVTRLDVAMVAENTFLELVAAQEEVRAAQADVDRRQVFDKSIHVLVDNQLRAGADASRADAELARARIALIRAEQQEEISRVGLAEAMGIAGTKVRIEPGPLLRSLPDMNPSVPSVAAHPLVKAENGRVNELRARVNILDHSYYPKFNLQSAVSARGTGANTNGTVAAGTSGLGLERGNWAVGLTVTFPVFDIFSIRAQKQIANSNQRAESARYDQTVQELTGQLEQARAALEGARRIADNTPIALEAARDNEAQARARYQAGLGTVVEVAEAESLLSQAEIDDALARLAVWHNFAALAAARGDLDPFIQLLRKKTPGGP